ncbi:unnamed protein product, partial [Mesorhabditis spiculigera]
MLNAKDPMHFIVGTDVGFLMTISRSKWGNYAGPRLYKSNMNVFGEVLCLKPSPFDEDVFVAGLSSGSISVHRTNHSAPLVILVPPAEARRRVVAIEWSPSYPSILYSIHSPDRVVTWDLGKGQQPLNVSKLFIPYGTSILCTHTWFAKPRTDSTGISYMAIGISDGQVQLHALEAVHPIVDSSITSIIKILKKAVPVIGFPAEAVPMRGSGIVPTPRGCLIWFLFFQLAAGLEKIEELQRYDGWFNNLANPDWGTVGSRLHRDAPSNYEDGVYMMDSSLPSARAISELLFKGPAGIPSQRNVTTMLTFFSQVVAYEIMHSTQTGCPLEITKIKVPRCDPVFDKSCEGKTEIPFTRAKYDKQTGLGFNSPREQTNERTSWIDASLLYSTQEPWVAALRSWKNGRLSEGDMKGYPPLNNPHIPINNPPPPQIHRLMNPERLFILGDARINENPGLLSFGLILFRWHNHWADEIQRNHPDWKDEDVFQAARRWVVATLQKIVMYDFVPALLADEAAVPPYRAYQPHVPPGISHAFATAAFRFPHSIVPPGMLLRKRGSKCEFRSEVGGYPALRLCQNWWNAQDIVKEYSVDEIVLGMASQITEAEDNIVVEDLRDYIFGPMHFTRLDVVSTSIMRGRDNGVPSYNVMRRQFGLSGKSWETLAPEFFSSPEGQARLRNLTNLYGNDINKLDAYVGGMLETNGTGPGELFSKIIMDQFVRLRDGDRFWFENQLNGIFNAEEIQRIHSISLRDIIKATTNIDASMLQENVFFWKDGDPCPQPFQVTYIFTLIGLACVPIVCFGVGQILVSRRKKMGWDSAYDGMNANAVDHHPDGEVHSCPAIEWLHETHCRSVVVVVEKSASLVVRKPRGGEKNRDRVLRRIKFPSNTTIKILLSHPKASSVHGPFCLIQVPKLHDLVVRLPSDSHSTEFLRHLNTSVAAIGSKVEKEHVENELLLSQAETKDKRKMKLDHFFREAYARAFDQPQLSDATLEFDSHEADMLATKLTRSEFADAIGMRENDLFVQRMFAVTAKKHQDTITFKEFLDVIRKFQAGDTKLKLTLLFTMCDRNGDGSVEKEEFVEFIKSLNGVAGVRLDPLQLGNVIDAIFYKNGIAPHQEKLLYDDFESLFQGDSIRRPVGVDFRGAKMRVNLDETESLNSFAVPPGNIACLTQDIFGSALSFLETYRQQIVILFAYFSVNALIFLERFWHYRYEVEHRDLRRVMGAGIAITRGAAGCISFNMALILLTVCRNVITLVRETPLGEYVPFDSAIAFHKIVAITCAVWAATHTIGHCVNFYHVATQSQEGLHCLFQEAVFGSNFLPTISYWFYNTITGLTGILLVCVMSIIYVFALPSIMRRAYHAFRLTHLLNFAFYALTMLHGLPRLLDSPKFWYYVIGPIIVFVIDRIIGMRQEYKKLQVLNAALLPSDIIYLQFKRPMSFKFKSGQWVRISSPAFSCNFNEHHAFSLASAPQAPTLELYIKAVGPWTWKLRAEIMKAQANSSPYPLIHLTGPYGDGNQDWTNYEVAVLIGGGIGVTPYASTLTDLVLETSSGKYNLVKCKKVYFLWICPTHKNYEWFVDVLKDVEDLDQGRILETHIFVTQFFHKFDLRTTMLYICEKHFRGSNQGSSMFTGLRAVNHFGRPNFETFFRFLQNKHNEIDDIGVFSCGPASVNKQIRLACGQANRIRDAPTFHHRFETF